MIVVADTNSIVARSPGSVMFQKSDQTPAPSTLAAS